MKNLTLITLVTLIAALYACEKAFQDIKAENNVANKGSWPQNPMPPQLTITYPKATWVDGVCPGYIWPQVCCDTVKLSLTVTAGRKWSGSPDKLSKYRIVVDNVIVEEKSINGSSTFSYIYTANLPNASMNVFDTTINKWHSLGVTVWQTDGKLASQGLYIYK